MGLFGGFGNWVRGYKLPPGPPVLPVIGSKPFIDIGEGKFMSKEAAWALKEKYESDIISFYMFGNQFILLFSNDVTAEAFQERDDILDRKETQFIRTFDPPYQGLVASCGELWKQTRHFGATHLGQPVIKNAEAKLLNEVLTLHDVLLDLEGKGEPIDTLPVMQPLVVNMICQLCLGKRFEYTDEEFLKFIVSLNITFYAFESDYAAMRQSPLSWLAPYVFSAKHKETTEAYWNLIAFIRKAVDEHKANFDGETKNDLIDSFLYEMKQKENEEDKGAYYEDQLVYMILDFFTAGAVSFTNLLRWGFLHFMANPEIATKIHEELGAKIGTGRDPKIDDIANTPYTEAYLLEVARLATVVNISVPHTPKTDIKFRDYDIPAGSVILACHAAMHRNPELFPDPTAVNVERFLSDDGKVINRGLAFPFGHGKRDCVGKYLVKYGIYLTFVKTVLNFELIPEHELDVSDRQASVFNTPQDFKLTLTKRA